MAGPGADYTTFEYLITEAHKQGLTGVTTELIDYAMENGNPLYAITKATVTFGEKSYEGIGDATRENTNRGIGPHLIRMSSTRSISRALRVALGVGKTAIEELGGEAEAGQRTPEAKPEARKQPKRREASKDSNNDTQTSGATPANLKLLKALADAVYADREEHLSGHEWMQRELGQPLDELTNDKAERMIEKLNAKQKEES